MTRQTFRTRVLASPPFPVFQCYPTVPDSACAAVVMTDQRSDVLLSRLPPDGYDFFDHIHQAKGVMVIVGIVAQLLAHAIHQPRFHGG